MESPPYSVSPDEKADYLLRVKDNQVHLHQDLQDWFAQAEQIGWVGMSCTYAQTIEKDHGRIEIRRCWAIDDPLAFEHIRHFEGWVDLHSMVRVERIRKLYNKVEHQVVYYISSLPNDAVRLLAAIRAHWAIENSLHWVMDIIFAEDDSRLRVGNSLHNMVILRHIALNLLKRDPSKGSLRQKRFRAALDTAFLQQLLAQI